MPAQKVSIIVTVRNEILSIDAFMGSVFAQEELPDELVIVDAMSTDGTWERLQAYQERCEKIGIQYVIHQKAGNRSVGRNQAISLARNEFICATDAGCILDSYWNKNLVQPARTACLTPEVRKGWYLPLATTPFQHALATYTCVMPDKLDPATFLPSSRSIAFTKSIWKAVGGYPEELDTCEDLVFAQRLEEYCRAHELDSVFAPDAIVYWPQKSTLSQAFWQFFGYARGDGQAIRYVFALRWRVVFIYVRYLFAVMLLASYFHRANPLPLLVFIGGSIAYLIWATWKNYRYVAAWRTRVYLPVLQIVSDVAVMAGFACGVLQSIFTKK